jgi:hypothetical protein
MRVVVLGGYGNFGARISRALAGDPSIDLVIAGRDGARYAALAGELGAAHAVLDSSAADFAQQLQSTGCELLIHTAGPFQGQAYEVAQAAARVGAHYVDLADGRRFVCDFAPAMDAAFRAAGRCAVAGASTVPALSCAVVDHALGEFSRLDTIDICIAPAQRAPRGVATLAGVLSYCGEPVRVWKEGRWQDVIGWADRTRVDFARLKTRRGAVCDIPDLELLPSRYPQAHSVMFRAALEVGFTQAVFAALSGLRRASLIPSPTFLAGVLHHTGGLFDAFGTPLGGMVVKLTGQGAHGQDLARAWHLTAPDFNGPEIPAMPAILLARKLASGKAWPAGAQACMGLLALTDFEPLFARWSMQTEWLGAPA